MRPPLLLACLAILLAAAVGDNAFTDFCLKGPFKTNTMQNDYTKCTKKIHFHSTKAEAIQYCKTQRFAGIVTNHQPDWFECVFEQTSVCRNEMHMIQNQCYFFEKSSMSSRESMCKRRGLNLLTHATTTMQALLTVFSAQQSMGHLWLNPYANTNITNNEIDSLLLLTYPNHHAATNFRGTFLHLDRNSEELHNVVCWEESTYTEKNLIIWCEMNRKEFLIPTVYDADARTCLYLTYNHYAVPSMTDSTIESTNRALHKRCRAFMEEDFIPIDVNYLMNGKINVLFQENHPVRLPGSPSTINGFADELGWNMYTSGVRHTGQSEVNRQRWIRTSGPRNYKLTALGGAYTLGLILRGEELKYTDVAPFTELPILCAATLNAETTTFVECNCPMTSECVNDKCVCPSHFKDRHSQFEYLDGSAAPTGRLCFDCTEEAYIILIIPLEYCAGTVKSDFEAYVEKMYDELDIENNHFRHLAIVGHGTRVSRIEFETARRGKSAFIKAFNDMFWDKAAESVFIMTELKEMLEDEIKTGRTDDRHTVSELKENAPSREIAYLNHPYLGIREAASMFPSKNVKKILVYYLHKGATVPFIATQWDFFLNFKRHNYIYFDQKALMTQNINLLLRTHVVDVVGVLAPRSVDHYLQQEQPISQAYNVFNYHKSFVYPRNTVPNFGEIAKYVDNMMCKSSTKYSGVDKFRLKP